MEQGDKWERAFLTGIRECSHLPISIIHVWCSCHLTINPGAGGGGVGGGEGGDDGRAGPHNHQAGGAGRLRQAAGPHVRQPRPYP